MARSKFEIRGQKELEAEGWIVDYKIRPSRFCPRGYQVDFFGLFDLIANHPDYSSVRWIAIKGQARVPSKLRRGIEDIDLGQSNIKEIWTYYKPSKTVKRKGKKVVIKCRNLKCKKEAYEE